MITVEDKEDQIKDHFQTIKIEKESDDILDKETKKRKIEHLNDYVRNSCDDEEAYEREEFQNKLYHIEKTRPVDDRCNNAFSPSEGGLLEEIASKRIKKIDIEHNDTISPKSLPNDITPDVTTSVALRNINEESIEYKSSFTRNTSSSKKIHRVIPWQLSPSGVTYIDDTNKKMTNINGNSNTKISEGKSEHENREYNSENNVINNNSKIQDGKTTTTTSLRLNHNKTENEIIEEQNKGSDRENDKQNADVHWDQRTCDRDTQSEQNDIKIIKIESLYEKVKQDNLRKKITSSLAHIKHDLSTTMSHSSTDYGEKRKRSEQVSIKSSPMDMQDQPSDNSHHGMVNIADNKLLKYDYLSSFKPSKHRENQSSTNIESTTKIPGTAPIRNLQVGPFQASYDALMQQSIENKNQAIAMPHKVAPETIRRHMEIQQQLESQKKWIDEHDTKIQLQTTEQVANFECTKASQVMNKSMITEIPHPLHREQHQHLHPQVRNPSTEYPNFQQKLQYFEDHIAILTKEIENLSKQKQYMLSPTRYDSQDELYKEIREETMDGKIRQLETYHKRQYEEIIRLCQHPNEKNYPVQQSRGYGPNKEIYHAQFVKNTLQRPNQDGRHLQFPPDDWLLRKMNFENLERLKLKQLEELKKMNSSREDNIIYTPGQGFVNPRAQYNGVSNIVHQRRENQPMIMNNTYKIVPSAQMSNISHHESLSYPNRFPMIAQSDMKPSFQVQSGSRPYYQVYPGVGPPSQLQPDLQPLIHCPNYSSATPNIQETHARSNLMISPRHPREPIRTQINHQEPIRVQIKHHEPIRAQINHRELIRTPIKVIYRQDRENGLHDNMLPVRGSEKQSKHQRRCGGCANEAQFICSACHDIWYCSQKCQLSDWKIHSKICPKINIFN